MGTVGIVVNLGAFSSSLIHATLQLVFEEGCQIYEHVQPLLELWRRRSGDEPLNLGDVNLDACRLVVCSAKPVEKLVGACTNGTVARKKRRRRHLGFRKLAELGVEIEFIHIVKVIVTELIGPEAVTAVGVRTHFDEGRGGGVRVDGDGVGGVGDGLRTGVGKANR